MRKLWPFVVVVIAACGSDSPGIPPAGEILGHVEISTDVPATGCMVLLEGVPIGAACDQDGGFDLKNVPAGRWDLRVFPDAKSDTAPSRRIAVGANSAFVSDLGAIQLAAPGAIGGHVKADDATLAVSYVAVPDIGAVTVPNPGGGYLLEGVAPGTREVVLVGPDGSVTDQHITVIAQKTTIGVNFDLGVAAAGNYNVTGHATRADGTSGGIQIQLLSALDAKVIDHATLAGDGTFSLTGGAGAYVVRATDPGNPATATIPSVVIGDHDVALASTLVIPQNHGDLDGDGIPDVRDPDIDGDGVANGLDAFPYDPAETVDSDNDGIGDRADLSSLGSGVDRHNPTPDSDGDGYLDFEDNCPNVANPDQHDTDQDGVGDACDTCPLIPNPDQTGICAQCLTNDQCGNEVCIANHCEACTSTTQCTNNRACNIAIGECVECVTDPDCGTGKACLDGVCVPACTSDTQCAGAFCVSGKCEQCRGTADCPIGDYCENGGCRSQCTTSGDCTGGRVCDPGTHTCVLACASGCTTGQTCVANVCQQVCDGSRPCPSGESCNGSGVCQPQCAVTADCAGIPHTLCNAGACVPDGSCSFDADCPTSEMCISGQCVARSTTYDTGLGYQCTSPCDCRQGETCDASKHCVNDAAAFADGTLRQLTPTFWAQAGATGNGATPTTPGDPAVGLSKLAAGGGAVIALRGGDSIAVAAPATLAEGNVALVGGYRVCAANRWVRDSASRTTITSAQTTVIAAPGTIAFGRPHVAVLGIAMHTSDTNSNHTRVGVSASYAPGLLLQDVDIVPVTPTSDPGAQSYGGVICDHCDALAMTNVSIGGIGSGTVMGLGFTGVSAPNSWATLSNVSVGGATNIDGYSGVVIMPSTGPVTATGLVVGSASAGTGYGFAVTCGTDGSGASYPVTLGNSQFGWLSQNLGRGGALAAGVSLQTCLQANVHDVIVDGTGMSVPTSAIRRGFNLVDSSGTLANDRVVFPDVSALGGEEDGFAFTGPRGAFTVSHPVISGGTGVGALHEMTVTGVQQGTIAIDHASFSTINANSVDGIDVVSSGAPLAPAVTLVDSTITTHGSGNNSATIGLSQASMRIERSTVVASAGQYNLPVTLTSSSTLELYDSFVFADATTNVNASSIGVAVEAQSTLYATGDTIDARGASGQSATIGLICDADSHSTVTSSLISGGLGNQHLMLSARGGANTCFVLSSFDHDYFWYPAVGGHTNGEGVDTFVTSAVGTADSRGNIVNDNVSCLDNSFPAPNDHLAAGSRCIDAGVPGQRGDGSVPTLDITGGPRVLGAAADIGCFEKQ